MTTTSPPTTPQTPAAPPSRGVPGWVGAVDGLVAGLLTVGLGTLLAALLTAVGAAGGQPAPVAAVSGAFIDRTPAWLKDFAIATFGTNDKRALLVGTVVVLALVCAAIGVLARRAADARARALRRGRCRRRRSRALTPGRIACRHRAHPAGRRCRAVVPQPGARRELRCDAVEPDATLGDRRPRRRCGGIRRQSRSAAARRRPRRPVRPSRPRRSRARRSPSPPAPTSASRD